MLFTAAAAGAHTCSHHMGSISAESRYDGSLPAFIELVEDATVFANCKSWGTGAPSADRSVTEMACKDPDESEDQDSEASSFGSVVPERLSHKARR